ncbi:hypothetical protein RI129_002221 [Pyrocoelia pectoralis]|uniref:RRM domain-containing protein n=1 Tax=Pyrocoelia pectoralis TaxID=417401 RepID=A0AAN7VP60_9COLE
MVANTKGMKRKSLAPQNTSPKKTPKVTSISASNTPAKLQKLSAPIKKNIPAKAKNVMKQPIKGVAKQKKAPPKVEQSDDDDEDEEEMSDAEELEMEEDSDMEDADSLGVEEEEDSVDGEEDSDNENDIEVDDNPADDDDDDDDESDSNEVEEKPIVKKIEKNIKPNNDQKKASTWERVSKDDQFVVFVGHLNFKTSEEEVRQHFRKAGVVAGVNLAKFRNNVSRGFGFIQMKDEAGFKKALKLNHTTLGGMQINVEVAKKSSLEQTNMKPKGRPRKTKKPAEA